MLGRFINIERLIHSLKTAIACIFGFLLTRLVGFHADQWIVVTIIVVMCAQIYVGSVVGKAYFRFIGTLCGCLFAAFTLILVGDSYLAIMFAIGLSSFIFSYIATAQESLMISGTLGATTTAIIMLGQKPTLTFAAERFLEISIGIFIATMVSQFILPIHARTHLRRSQADTLKQIRDFYQAIMMPDTDISTSHLRDMDEAIAQSLIKQRQLAKESVREPFGVTFDTAHFFKSLQCEKDILRSIIFMHNAYSQVDEVKNFLNKSPAFAAFNLTILQSLDKLIAAIASEKPTTDLFIIPSPKLLREEIENHIKITSREKLIYLDGFYCSAEILINSLSKLARLFGVLTNTENISLNLD